MACKGQMSGWNPYFCGMGKRLPRNQQWIIWSGGLLAAWVLLLLPYWPAQSQSPVYRQAQVSCASPENDLHEPDCSPTVCHHESIALVSSRAGFSFLPSLEVLPWFVSPLFRALHLELPGRLQGSFFLFGSLRPIFEHQIAINAP